MQPAGHQLEITVLKSKRHDLKNHANMGLESVFIQDFITLLLWGLWQKFTKGTLHVG